jgi:hypothetical protein
MRKGNQHDFTQAYTPWLKGTSDSSLHVLRDRSGTRASEFTYNGTSASEFTYNGTSASEFTYNGTSASEFTCNGTSASEFTCKSSRQWDKCLRVYM